MSFFRDGDLFLPGSSLKTGVFADGDLFLPVSSLKTGVFADGGTPGGMGGAAVRQNGDNLRSKSGQTFFQH